MRRSAADRRKGKTDWARLRAMTEDEIERGAAEDADNPAWTEGELANAQLSLPTSEAKVPLSIRLDPEVVDYFRAGGRGYQSRINAVLRAYVRSRTQQRKTGS